MNMQLHSTSNDNYHIKEEEELTQLLSQDH